MIAVLASRLDQEATALVAAWSAAGAALLSAEDLCSPGWIFDPGDPAAGTAVVAGQAVPVASLRAVLTRRPAVVAEELGAIAAADRSYVAAELNAFMVGWLSALPCRVVNRPTTRSLCGPAWNRLQWQAAAARAGVAWCDDPPDDPAALHTVVVCGDIVRCAPDADAADAACRLARHAGVELLAVQMFGGGVCGVSVAPDLRDDTTQAVLLDALRRPR